MDELDLNILSPHFTNSEAAVEYLERLRWPNGPVCARCGQVETDERKHYRIKRKGSTRPVVLACTLVPYDEQFELGTTLKEAAASVRLNHPHCAKFCVLGGGSCSAS